MENINMYVIKKINIPHNFFSFSSCLPAGSLKTPI